jgi:predicted small secreted protein
VIIMRKLILVAAVALTASLALTACNKQAGQEAGQQTAQQTPKPTDPNDAKAWNAYLGEIVQKNMEGMTANQPYAYLIKAPVDDDAKEQNGRQLQNVQETVARGVLPGNMLVFAGPDSTTTADLVIAAFKDASAGAFKGVIVLFIGDAADQQRVEDALKPTGATFRFVAM